MKKILMGLLGGTVLMSAQAHALSCEVSYKVKKINNDRYLFSDIPTPSYRAGKVRAKGSTLARCKNNALRKVTTNKWRVIYAVGKRV